MKIAIIVNEQRKDASILDRALLDQLADEYNLAYDLFFISPNQFEDFMADISKKPYNAFVVGGGDGTIRAASQYLINKDAPLAILPLGTFNYFARELNHVKDIKSIFKMIKNHKIKNVDVGDVNGLIFINHSAIGFYSRILKLKDKHKHFLGKNKFLKILFSAINLLKVIPIYNLTIIMENKEVTKQTCLIFIGNNYHFTNLLDFGGRQTLTSGVLAIYILNAKTRWELIKCFFSVLFNTFDKRKYLSQIYTDNMVLSANSKSINVILDGELFKLDTPLVYKIHNKKLAVVVP